jgi:predicted metal-dependent peptidase
MQPNSVARERIMKARAKMLIKHPFFAVLMMGMQMVIDDTFPTAATDMKTMWINPAFVETINDDVLMFVLAHEIDHAAKKHCLRRGGREALPWNVACDYSNNLFLKDCGFKIWEEALIDERFRDESKFAMSADRIFNIIMKEQQDQQSGGQRGQDGDDGDDQQGSSPGQGQGQPGIGEPGSGHSSPMLGDIQEPEELNDPVAQDKLERDIHQKVAQAATMAKMMGNMPGALERFVDQILAPQVPWYDKLRHLMAEVKPEDEDWSRRNRRCRTIYLPTDHTERMGGIGIINDTSMSISDEELIKFNSEAYSVIEDLKPEWVRILWADTRVASEQLFEPGDPFTPKPTGGGGTDMRVPLREMAKEEPPYPLIVCCTTQAQCPVGDVIRID